MSSSQKIVAKGYMFQVCNFLAAINPQPQHTSVNSPSPSILFFLPSSPPVRSAPTAAATARPKQQEKKSFESAPARPNSDRDRDGRDQL